VTIRVALRSLAARPVRSAVLACGFGFGIGVMAGLLGIGEVILEQARSPDLAGGGDVVVSGFAGRVTSARFVMESVLRTPPLEGRAAAVSPSSGGQLYLVEGGSVVPVDARGGIPSLEKALGDPETSGIEAWTDAPSDLDWTAPDPGGVLRAMDLFHPIPDVPSRAGSWAEWLYFNGRTSDVKFYLSFIFGPEDETGHRTSRVRLQLDRDGRMTNYSDGAEVAAVELLATAPDVAIGGSTVRLEGLRYRIRLALYRERSGSHPSRESTMPDLTGEIFLDAVPGRSLPPFQVRGARGWVSGYVVPVLSGSIAGTLDVEGEAIDLDGGTGYHDHNWGFWQGVTWQWGQVVGEGLSFVFGRIRPPADASEHYLSGFMMALGPDGPVGFSTNVRIIEKDDPETGRPHRITVLGNSNALDLKMDLTIEDTVSTRLEGGRFSPDEEVSLDFLQIRATYHVTGRAGDQELDFTAKGAAETFRGN
jgi:hypothetical protein